MKVVIREPLKSDFLSFYPRTLKRPHHLTCPAAYEEGSEMRRANLSRQLYGLLIFACVICLFPVFPLPAIGSSAAIPTGKWTATGSLAVGRSFHTATLLNSGEVLVVGGGDASGISLSSCEIYNPSSGTWTETGSLLTARQYHTATLLPSGKVLVTGGLDATGAALNSCELFDPSTGTWTATGTFGFWRSNHTATLLPNGTVLAAGGFDLFNVATSRCDTYDPSTGTWTVTGSLATARGSHTATLLTDGTVLAVAGLGAPPNSLSSCELYDPSTGAWTATASLPGARTYHTATLLADGDVLAAGGRVLTASGGGAPSAVVQTLGDLFLIGSHSWLEVSKEEIAAYSRAGIDIFLHNGPVHEDQAVSPDSLVLVAGGVGDSGVLSSCDIFDSSTRKWTLTGSLANARYAFTTTLLNSGKVLAAGGGTATNTVLSSCEIFTLSSTPPPPIKVPGAPTGVTAAVTANNAQATVSFKVPASNGGSTITGYTVTSKPGGINAQGAGSPITVTGLTFGTAYTFTVTAANEIGTGPASKPSNKVTPYTLPGAPLDVTAKAGNAEVTVSFKAPASNGSAITDYTVTSSPGGITAKGARSPMAVKGLTNGTAYTFTVTATNKAGTGVASSASNSVTPTK
jgi:hypothetical protein